jgi:hypothetical protein
MSKQSSTHYHLTYKHGNEPIVRQPETITGGDAAMRLVEEIAAGFVKVGCRVVKYSVGIRIYDCKDSSKSDQSFEVHICKDTECGMMPEQSEYGRWGKVERQKYLTVLKARGLLA